MKNLVSKIYLGICLITLISGCILSCCKKNADIVEKSIVSDSIIVEKVRIDTILVFNKEREDSLAKCLKIANDSLRFYRDSIQYQDYINARRIEKVKYYINICDKKPSQKKFFFGWIKRAVSE